MNWFDASLLGLLEGLTEFLPISSTGHLILGSHLLGIVQDDLFIVFEIAIQLGAILAVCVSFWRKLLDVELLKKIALGFIPTGIVGFTVFPYIKNLLTSELTVAVMLLVGGGVILVVEKWYATQATHTRDVLTYTDALLLGCAQCLALVPGVSRSGAVMMSGLGLKLTRDVASEFAFLLAIPTMFAATGYTLLKHRDVLSLEYMWSMSIGFVVAFMTANIVIAVFLRYIRTHSFVPFGWYRIILGAALILFIT
jgi:undecaprenyl-diphosphatase